MRVAAGAAALGLVVLGVGGRSSDGGDTGDGDGAAAAPANPHCAPDAGAYDGLRRHLAEAGDGEAWADRVAVCAGGTVLVDQAGLDAGAADREALAVCDAAAGYLITRPPPPERSGAPNAREVGVIVIDQNGHPVALGAEDEIAAATGAGSEAEREAEARSSDPAEGSRREAEPHRCFDPFT